MKNFNKKIDPWLRLITLRRTVGQGQNEIYIRNIQTTTQINLISTVKGRLTSFFVFNVHSRSNLKCKSPQMHSRKIKKMTDTYLQGSLDSSLINSGIKKCSKAKLKLKKTKPRNKNILKGEDVRKTWTDLSLPTNKLILIKAKNENSKIHLPVIQSRNSSIQLREQAKAEFASMVYPEKLTNITSKNSIRMSKDRVNKNSTRVSVSSFEKEYVLDNMKSAQKFIHRNKNQTFGKTLSHETSINLPLKSPNLSTLQLESKPVWSSLSGKETEKHIKLKILKNIEAQKVIAFLKFRTIS